MIHHGDWRQVVEQKRVYDLVVADPPYGITSCTWDNEIDVENLWECIYHVAHETTVVVLTSAQPFTSRLVLAAETWFRYELVWEKTKPVGHLNVKKRPLVAHESVLVFSPAPLGQHTYNPQTMPGSPYKGRTRKVHESTYGKHGSHREDNPGLRHPRSVLLIPGQERGWHPTRKPLELMRWIVRTYSNPGDSVLEPYGGSCPVHRACMELQRQCDAYEVSPGYHALAVAELARPLAQVEETPPL